MPEMHFTVRWPTGETERCYSPSYVVEDYFAVGQDYEVSDFLARARTSLGLASERVRARYGMACASALDQLARIEQVGGALSPEHRQGRVRVVAFEKHPPRDARAGRRDEGENR